jgi:acetyltransferase
MNSNGLTTLFAPRCIAVVGASNTPGTVGFSLMKNLLELPYQGTVIPINPKYENVAGIRAYSSVASIPESVDMAIIATPAQTVPDIVVSCGEKGIKSLVIISAGFKEIGLEGVKLMEKVHEAIATYDMTVLGPNCMGFLCPHIHLNASFGRKSARPGNIAFLSQSGALGSALLDWSYAENVGFSAFVSVGDMVDVGFADLLRYFAHDEKTKSIVIYMESLEHADVFLSVARECAKIKPIIVLKVGKSEEGARAAQSHTGSLTGNDSVFDAAFARAGIIRVHSVSDLFDVAKTLAMQPIPAGNRLAIVTNAGGPGVIATDEIIKNGGHLASLTSSTMESLNTAMPQHWSHGNPVDVLGDANAQRYKIAIDACLNDENVDGVVVVLTPQAMTDAVGIAKEIVSNFSRTKKPILASFMGEDDVNIASVALELGNIPVFEEPERAIDAFMYTYAYSKGLTYLDAPIQYINTGYSNKTEDNQKLIDKTYKEGCLVLTEPDAKKFLANYGINSPKGGFAGTKDELLGVCETLPFPLAMKVVSPEILHRTDVGGVIIDIATRQDACNAYDTMLASVRSHMPHVRIDGVYIESMVHKKFELLLGCKKDSIFGPVIIFGSGGIAVEVFKDTAIGLPPLDIKEARRLIEQTKIFQLLSGYRGLPGVDLDELTVLLSRFSQLVMDFPQIKELDINPLSCDRSGFVALDAKVLLVPIV